MPVTLRSGQPPLPDAIAFDCYDTLFLNSHDGWKETFAEIIEDQHLPIDKEEFWTRWRHYEVNFRKIRTDLGRPYNSPPFKSYRTAWTECFTQVFDDMNLNADAKKAGDRASLHMTNRPIFPETVEALRLLQGRVKLGVFSNAGLSFDFVASSQSAQVYKPALAAVEHLYAGLETNPDKVWYVGDKLFDDILGGYRSGATTIWINRNGEEVDREPEPDIEINDLRELSGILEHIGG